MYESDITKFLLQLKKDHPELEEAQRKGRSLLWDKAPTDLSATQAQAESKVAMKAYPYQTKS